MMTTPWAVTREWDGETVAVLASGPSMSRDIADYVRGKCRVIAVSNQGIDTYIRRGKEKGELVPALAPWADVLYASDIKWWDQYQDRALKFAGRKVTLYHQSKFPTVYSLHVSNSAPYDDRPTHLFSGGNSGFSGLQLAVKLGAARVLMLGFNMSSHGGKDHWFGKHEGRCDLKMNYKRWLVHFTQFGIAVKRMGIDVINCTENSALTTFPKARLEEVLQ